MIPTLRELENKERLKNSEQQIKKIQESAIKLTEISKQIVRSKLYERAIKSRQREKQMQFVYGMSTKRASPNRV